MEHSDLPEMTAAELARHNGSGESGKCYLALKGIVFDVSNADFYKPGGPYHVLAGHEASVALAKMSKDEEYLNTDKYKWNEFLDENEKIVLDQWYTRLADKYPKVARLVA